MNPIRVVIADDHTLFREGLKRLLASEKSVQVIGEASNNKEAVDVVARMRPDILILDLKMPSGDAVETLEEIAAESPATKVVILTAFSEEENVLHTAKGRARGYVLKGVSTATLIEALKKVNAGEIWVDQELSARADFERITRSLSVDFVPPASDTLQALTKRELEIVRLVAEGLSNEEIGKKIFISPKTVKTHLSNIFDKLQVHNRFKAALLVMPKH
ncbi:MAG TPA: response regulator transcription factor [Candidatus Binatia bacterium]|nr:response regulator transcription factor [Candidatus Binatia bacterium]